MIRLGLILGWLGVRLWAASEPGQASTHEVVRWKPTGIQAVDLAVARNLVASVCPASFKDKLGRPRAGDLVLACLVLNALGEQPITTIGEVYVIKGKVSFTGKLLLAMAARHGWELEPLEETGESATWRIRRVGDEWKPPVTITLADARKAGWTSNVLYDQFPARMLGWRCISYLVDHYAPGLKLGIDDGAARAGATVDWEPGPEPTGEVSAMDSPGLAPAESPGPAPVVVPHAGEPATLAGQGPEPVTPAEVIDNTPEARGLVPEDELDPARPF